MTCNKCGMGRIGAGDRSQGIFCHGSAAISTRQSIWSGQPLMRCRLATCRTLMVICRLERATAQSDTDPCACCDPRVTVSGRTLTIVGCVVRSGRPLRATRCPERATAHPCACYHPRVTVSGRTLTILGCIVRSGRPLIVNIPCGYPRVRVSDESQDTRLPLIVRGSNGRASQRHGQDHMREMAGLTRCWFATAIHTPSRRRDTLPSCIPYHSQP